MTPKGAMVRMTDRSALLKWVPFLTINNYSKFEINIFSKCRDTRKRLILSKKSKSKRGITMTKTL